MEPNLIQRLLKRLQKIQAFFAKLADFLAVVTHFLSAKEQPPVSTQQREEIAIEPPQAEPVRYVAPSVAISADPINYELRDNIAELQSRFGHTPGEGRKLPREITPDDERRWKIAHQDLQNQRTRGAQEKLGVSEAGLAPAASIRPAGKAMTGREKFEALLARADQEVAAREAREQPQHGVETIRTEEAPKPSPGPRTSEKTTDGTMTGQERFADPLAQPEREALDSLFAKADEALRAREKREAMRPRPKVRGPSRDI